MTAPTPGPVQKLLSGLAFGYHGESMENIARAHDEADARKDALATRAFAALMSLAIHNNICALCGNLFGHEDDCIVADLCSHEMRYRNMLFGGTTQFCEACNKRIPDDN